MPRRVTTTIKLNHPYISSRKDKKLMVFVKNPKTNRINTIHFGQKGYKHNYSKNAWKRFMARSSKIKNKEGKRTKDNPLSANYWSRKILWKSSKWRNKK